MATKEWSLNEVKDAPLSVKMAAGLFQRITSNYAVTSSHAEDKEYPNLHRKLKIDSSNVYFGIVKQPKGLPEIVFVGTGSDLTHMQASFEEQTGKTGWNLSIQSPEGERTIVITDTKDMGARTTVNIIPDSSGLGASMRSLATGELLSDVNPSQRADLIMVFVGSQLQEGDAPVGSVNAFA